MTVRVEESVHIAKPPPDVWDAIADYAFDLEWRKGLSEMTPDPPGPPAKGTKVHEVVRNSGRDYVADTVVTEVRPRRLLPLLRRRHDRGAQRRPGGARRRRGRAVHVHHRAGAPGRHAAVETRTGADGPLGAEEGPPEAQDAARRGLGTTT